MPFRSPSRATPQERPVSSSPRPASLFSFGLGLPQANPRLPTAASTAREGPGCNVSANVKGRATECGISGVALDRLFPEPDVYEALARLVATAGLAARLVS